MRRYEHVGGPERAALGDEIAKQYKEGMSIRTIAAGLGRSYGFVHRLLLEQPDLALRPRGVQAGTKRKISDSPAVEVTADDPAA